MIVNSDVDGYQTTTDNNRILPN